MTNLISDVSILTDVSETILKKFISVSNSCIGHAMHESLLERRDTVDIDIGIGKLQLKLDEQSIKYRFVPSKDLENVLIETVNSNCSPIVSRLDCKLQEKINRAYKELL